MIRNCIYSILFLILSNHYNAQVLDSLRHSNDAYTERKHVKFKFNSSLAQSKIYRDNFTGKLYFQNGFDRSTIYQSNFENRCDLQKNLDELNFKSQINAFNVPKTMFNPNGNVTLKQTIITGFLNEIKKQ